jgi:cytochrome oxidase Cu insertion factor (SCO1/SenC/PrrC family)
MAAPCFSRERRWVLALGMGLVARPVFAAPASVYALGLEFIDDRARPRRLAEWQGRPVIIALAYGACRKICSTTLRTLEVLHDAAQRKALAMEFVVVSIDPAQDTPQAWADYRKLRGLVDTNWTFLCGSAQATHTLAHARGVRYWSYDDHIVHDYKVVRLAGDGSIAASLKWSDEQVERLL